MPGQPQLLSVAVPLNYCQVWNIKNNKAKSRLRKKPTYRPRPFSWGADVTQSPMQYPRGAEQTSVPEQPTVLTCFGSGTRQNFRCLGLCLAWTLIPEEHKYLFLTYQSEVTGDINADPINADLDFSSNSVLS